MPPPVAPAASPDAAHSRRLTATMVAAGLAGFGLLYCTQPLLPLIGAQFGVGPTAASLTVSASTGALALAVLPVSSLAEAIGRPRVMRTAMVAATGLTLLCALAPAFWLLIGLRTAVGVALAGVVAVAMGHLGDEADPASLSSAMGVYVSGTTLGGAGGRLVAAGVGDAGSWRVAVGAVGVGAAAAVAAFLVLLPPARRFTPSPPDARLLARQLREHLRDPGIVLLCLVAMLLMGGFVAAYNFLGYRLLAAPFRLRPALVGLVFLAYLAGTVSSTAAGRLADRYGRRPVLAASIVVMLAGVATTVPDQLACVLVGLVVLTAGFFGAHSVASGWVAQRATRARAQASALYLLAYYVGSSLLGSLAGWAFSAGGWSAVAAVIGALAVLALGCSVALSERPAHRRQPA